MQLTAVRTSRRTAARLAEPTGAAVAPSSAVAHLLFVRRLATRMPETTINSGSGRRRAPFCVLLPMLTIPFGVIAVTVLLPPSASGQNVFFIAAMFFRVVLLPACSYYIHSRLRRTLSQRHLSVLPLLSCRASRSCRRCGAHHVRLPLWPRSVSHQ